MLQGRWPQLVPQSHVAPRWQEEWSESLPRHLRIVAACSGHATFQPSATSYCLDLLCPLTLSAVRRMRRLIALCSFRARASVSATFSSLSLSRDGVSGDANQCALSL